MRYIISLLLTSTALPALAEVPRVVTDIPPVHAIAAQVMGDLGQPELLLDKGANDHSYQMRPSQAASLASADLLLWIGPELTPWLDRAVDSLSPDTARIALLQTKGTYLRSYGQSTDDDHGDAHGHGHDDHGHDDHGHAEKAAADAGHDDHAGHDAHGHEAEGHAEESHAGESHDGHDHSGTDPHAWLDPANVSNWALAIGAELSRLDPANAGTYAANAKAAQDRIAALDAEVAAILEPVKDKPFVVFHDAYSYFASHYGLNVAGSIALGDAAAPGAARLRDLSAKLAEGQALCLFPEVQHDPALAAQLAEGTDVRIGTALDPSGSSLDAGPDTYEALMRGMATAIADCLNG